MIFRIKSGALAILSVKRNIDSSLAKKHKHSSNIIAEKSRVRAEPEVFNTQHLRFISR